ncbi:MAG TPA: hypothetical protein PK765_02645 [bacterium]|nr:hypothetical protein [bacterium]
MAIGNIVSHRIKNAVAKTFVVGWIASLMVAAYWLVHFAFAFDPNIWFGLSGDRMLSADASLELRLIVIMFAASLTGGTVFMIRDFYQSIKYSNIYDRAYDDYRARMMGIAEFQRIVTLDVYLGRFNYTWTFWFLLQPVMSSVLGVIAYAIARSGLASMLGATGDELSIRSLYLYIVFSFLSGFSSHKFIAWLDRLADSVFKAPATERYQQTKQAVESATAADRADLRSEVVSTKRDPVVVSSPSELGTPGTETLSSVELAKVAPVSPPTPAGAG